MRSLNDRLGALLVSHDASLASVGASLPPLGLQWLHDLDLIQHRNAYVDDASETSDEDDEDDEEDDCEWNDEAGY